MREVAPPPTLPAAIAEALDQLPGQRLNATSGELRPWSRSSKRIMAYLAEQYPEVWPRWERAAPHQIRQVRRQQRNARFAEVRDLSPKALDQQITAVDRTIRQFERRAAAAPNAAIRDHWQAEANKRIGRLSMLTAERQQREAREARRIEQHGYSLAERAEMLDRADAVLAEIRARCLQRVLPAPAGVSTTPPARATTPESAVLVETKDRASEIRSSAPPTGWRAVVARLIDQRDQRQAAGGAP